MVKYVQLLFIPKNGLKRSDIAVTKGVVGVLVDLPGAGNGMLRETSRRSSRERHTVKFGYAYLGITAEYISRRYKSLRNRGRARWGVISHWPDGKYDGEQISWWSVVRKIISPDTCKPTEKRELVSIDLPSFKFTVLCSNSSCIESGDAVSNCHI